MSTNYYDIYQNSPKFSDEFFGQFLRTIGKAYTQCADIGECYITLNKIKDEDFDSWFNAWSEIAYYLQHSANESWNRKHYQTAAMTYLRATEYHRASEFFLRGNMNDGRILPCFDQMQYCFERSLTGLHPSAKKVLIPYDNTTLPGYLFLTRGNAKATLIAPGGYDSCVEEMYPLVNVSLQHGYNLFIFDAPGQGHALRRQRLHMRHDFEQVMSQVIDFLEIEFKHELQSYVLVGRSFGGYLAPRAACFESRLSGLICDPGQLDIAGALNKIIPTEIQPQFEREDQEAVNTYFSKLFSKNKMKAFYFLSRMNTHGITTPYDYFQEMKQYTLKDKVHNIKCPTLVCDNPSDKISNRGNTLFDALQCDKTYATFTAKWGAGMHCEADGTGQFQAVMFDWLDEKFAK